MIAALGMLRSLHRQATEEAARLGKQAAAMANAIAALEARKGVLKAKPVGAHHISPKGLRSIKAAQQARWQAYRKQQAQLAKGK